MLATSACVAAWVLEGRHGARDFSRRHFAGLICLRRRRLGHAPPGDDIRSWGSGDAA